ncbi:phospholipase D family protein [Steroidobacter agaridevorans]|uniref:Phospholipase D family protein n=1 Tax=Steroidobacter agaridevorans TaxID=2695856 RepID=A0A829YB85_9GAMM|nr:phospholipase D family protein [Steroidobacter agaridevorans]GFE80088.1 phospholipase D family protein [Steroidobacter agaridevorans]GFE89942.1 phospholipase D family protein [Steroidobacter agaridevorans]
MSFSIEGVLSTTGTQATRLHQAIDPALRSHPGASGIFALESGRDAFAARALLAAAAERSIDVECYIWRGDVTGYLMFEALWNAAERGVRVRLLLDDNNTTGLDQTIAALDAHENIEVRLFNPLRHRRLRWINYVRDFRRVNRRMHNKSFTVDKEVTVVGGRNVGDEYFDAGGAMTFADLDVMAVGPIASEVSNNFDLYFNSESAHRAESVLGKASSEAIRNLKAAFAATHARPGSAQYLEALDETGFVTQLEEGRLAMEWVDARLVSDDPAKVLHAEPPRDLLMLPRLLQLTGQARVQFDLISPYFVPAIRGTKDLVQLARQGVRVRVLTNSLASTDVAAVHAGYAKRRKALLRAGLEIYEVKRVEPTPASLTRGSSAASLHAKTFEIDGRYVYVGSFNFDPRSAYLNTEMGLLLDSPQLARRLNHFFETQAPAHSYRVRLDEHDELQWIETTATGQRAHRIEPHTSVFQRAALRVIAALPIDWLL